jgi:hypothetical protein
VPDPVFFLTEGDRDALARLIERERRGTKNVGSRKFLDVDDGPTPPEVYLARTPAAGIGAIPAGTGTGTVGEDVSGVECDIYRLSFEAGVADLEATGLTRDVYNPFALDIPGSTWVLVARDKWGQWFVTCPIPPAACDVAVTALTNVSTTPTVCGVQLTFSRSAFTCDGETPLPDIVIDVSVPIVDKTVVTAVSFNSATCQLTVTTETIKAVDC